MKITLEVGDLAPDFTLKDENNEEFRLSEQYKKSRIMLVFIRGQW